MRNSLLDSFEGGTLIYAGDTGEKMGYFDHALLHRLGVDVDSHGKMPDVVLYYPKKNWLLLVECVTSHGPVDGKRHEELLNLFGGSQARPRLCNRVSFTIRHGAISQPTSHGKPRSGSRTLPSHLIHFDGVRFLGPYPARK